jgi:segregation and condensation protein B
MAKPSSTPTTDAPAPKDVPRESPLSLNRLREAFASMLGQPDSRKNENKSTEKQLTAARTSSLQSSAPCDVNPRSIAEAMLFVGRPDNGTWSSRELAAAMRGVSPGEIDDVISVLNAQYDTDGAPYFIEQSGGGYRLILRPQFERMRDKFYGRVKEARLSPAAIEVLSVVAYHQPSTVEQLNELRGSPCGSALSTLVRRKLVHVERPADGGEPLYSTTDRFLKLFGLQSLAELPRSEELERA